MSINIKTMTASEYAKLKKQPVTDFTVDGKCTNCGGCCSNIIPMTKDEAEKLRGIVAERGLESMTPFNRPDFEWPKNSSQVMDIRPS